MFYRIYFLLFDMCCLKLFIQFHGANFDSKNIDRNEP